MVAGRCEITTRVRAFRNVLSPCSKAAAVGSSRALVISSKIRMLGLCNKVRANATLFFSPPEGRLPSGPSGSSSPPGTFASTRSSWVRAAMLMRSSSVARGLPQRRFSRILSSKRIGSCGTNVTTERTLRRLALRMSWPSTRMCPDSGSQSRVARSPMVLFPEPLGIRRSTSLAVNCLTSRLRAVGL